MLFILKAKKSLLMGLGISGNFKKRDKLRFTIHAADHCNLNCQCCDHYSPLALERYLNLNIYERDCARLAQLEYKCGGNKIEEIRIAGGEPLLHPELDKIINITRNYFENSNIDIITNGILLHKMHQCFWDSCAKCNVRIQVTKYPISIDFEQIVKLAKENNVCLEFYGDSTVIKTSYFRPLDINGRQSNKKMFSMCDMANKCIQLEEGFIYTCSPPLTIKHFNRYFNMDVQTIENDRINIYKVESIDEILDFCRKPIAFCHYCNLKKMTFGKKWEVSKRIISEWI